MKIAKEAIDVIAKETNILFRVNKTTNWWQHIKQRQFLLKRCC